MGRTLSEPEFNDLKAKVLASAPPNLTEADFTRWAGPAMAAAIGEAENSPTPLEGSAVSRLVSNFGAQVNPVSIVSGLYQAVRHPWDTTANILQAQGAELGKAATAAREGRLVEAVGHGAAGLVPLVGPAAAAAGEQIAQGDIAGGLGTGAGLVAATVAPEVIRRVPAVVQAVAPGTAAALQRGAVARYVDVMVPKVGANKVRFGGMAEAVAPTLVEEPGLGAWSRTGLAGKVGTALDAATGQLDAALDAQLTARTFETQPLLDALQARRDALTAKAVDASQVRGPRPAAPETGTAFQAAAGEQVPGSASPITRPVGRTATQARETGTSFYPQAETVPLDRPIGRAATQARETGTGFSTGRPGEAIPPTAVDRAVLSRGTPLGADVVPGPNTARVAVIDQAMAELQQLGPYARYDPLRVLRMAYDQQAKVKYAPSMTADFLQKAGAASGAADVTGALREFLATKEPAIAEANARYSLMRKASDVLEATAEVERTRPTVGRRIMTTFLTSALGESAAGVKGMAAGALLGPVADAAMRAGLTTKLQVARLMNELATAIERGSPTAAASVGARLRRLAPQLGLRLDQLAAAPAAAVAQGSPPD